MSPMADLGPPLPCDQTFVPGQRAVACLMTGCTRCWSGRNEAERRVLRGGGCLDCHLCERAARKLMGEGFIFPPLKGH